MVDLTCIPERAFTQKDAHALFRGDFRSFARKGFACLFPNATLEDNWHIDAICYQLQRVIEGDTRRLMILLPPRSLKSLITSVFWPAFIIGNDPSKTVLAVSHTLSLATKLSNQFRQLISHPEIQAIFPVFKGILPKDSEQEVTTPQGGGRIAVSVDSNVTGRGGDTIIIDDPLDASDADNENACLDVCEWIDNTLSTRLNHPTKSSIVLVMQRLSIFDPAAHLAEQEDWEQLSFPAIAIKDEKIAIGKGIYHFRKPGDLLHASRYPRDYLETQKRKMGKRAFEAQFQQAPLPDGGGLIDVSKFKRYKELPKTCDLRFFSIDAASGSNSGSFTVIMGGRIIDGKLYITNVVRKRFSFPELCRLTLKATLENRVDHLVIEKTSNGIALIEHLDENLQNTDFICRFPSYVQSISPRQDKTTRMEKAMVAVEEGKVLLPEEAPWLADLETEMRAFPEGRHDDQVDAISQAVKFSTWYMQQPWAEEKLCRRRRR